MGFLLRTPDGYRYPKRRKPPRHESACWRVHRALHRLSRGQWLRPPELMRIGMSLASRCSDQPLQTLEQVLPPAAREVGLLDGSPPLGPWDRGYRRAVELANSRRRFRNDAARELELLALILKSMTK